ncbi:Transcription initiation factor IIA large subunit, partial [Linum perenne]
YIPLFILFFSSVSDLPHRPSISLSLHTSQTSILSAARPRKIVSARSNFVLPGGFWFLRAGRNMAASATTSTVYIQVIEDVVNKVREEFINNGGPGEAVLTELQGIWEMKMMQAGVILGPIDRSSAQKQAAGGPTPVHDLNVPYEGTEEYETPTAEMLFTPTPLQTPMQTPLPAQTPLPGTAQTPLPGTADNSLYNIPTGNSSEYPTPFSDTGVSNGNTEAKPGRPSPYMEPPSPWMQQRPAIGVDVNVAYEEGREEADRGALNNPLTQDFFANSSGKRKRDDFPPPYNSGGYIPQQDGAGDSIIEISQGGSGKDFLNTFKVVSAVNNQFVANSVRIPQLDGPAPDPYDDNNGLSTPNIYNYQGAVNEDYNIVNTPAPNELQASTPALVPQNDPDDDEEEPLNEDDDDEEDLDDDDEREELNTQHLVLAQFDKVTRAKSRWKCTLKDGIMHINNKDILFNKANGEFDF